ncbi:hypothetical protein ACFO3E_09850 [Sphingobium tyrosinilyticum]|uniref:Uncharacterized protein n=2 Tax=Sphingomonadaceae TaxID=41297 RepID=A0ABV9F0P6_9SPHN
MTAPSGETSSGAATVPSPITAAPELALVYPPPARTNIGQVSAPSHSLDGLLSEAGFFSRSAAAETSASTAAEPAASSAMPAALSAAEVVARAAYAIVAEAGADSATASLIKQFG